MGAAMSQQQFASDNNAGLCPEALAALTEANAAAHTTGYGDDRWTERACDAIRALFEAEAEVFFFVSGTAVLTADTPGAKLTPEAVERLAASGRSFHSVKPQALSLTQATEMGTVYSLEELRALTGVARRHGLKVH